MDGILGVENFDTSLAEGLMLLTPFAADSTDEKTQNLSLIHIFMHQKKNMGEVELATVSFGQSFQITPVQLAATVSSLINGGRRVTPHFGVAVLNPDRTEGEKLIFPVKEGIVSEETSKEIREIQMCIRDRIRTGISI